MQRGVNHAVLVAKLKKSFRVSTGLKDLIGRDLITDDFVAVFELVKNSFDAHAKNVRLHFLDDKIVIVDDGKGMSQASILEKWLFVAYSAKRDGTEDADYRDKIDGRHRPFAGAKGVGRFSCDRLGACLRLSSHSSGQPVQILDVDWQLYEQDAKEEFTDILVDLSEADSFPDPSFQPKGKNGTVLEISNLRAGWNRDKLGALKRELSKLIDPFGGGAKRFRIEIEAPAEESQDHEDRLYNQRKREDQADRLIINGPVENPILEVLSDRTTSIKIELSDNGKSIISTLEDRGELIYKISEANPFPAIKNTDLLAEIYFLNRSAKAVFARRMGLSSKDFGSIFLFRNGFRVFPIGADGDDFFGLELRKSQGTRRFLGGRDLIGRVDIVGVDGFDEATSRNQGLIKTPQVAELIDCIREKCVRRLERYVVDITWKDAIDQEYGDLTRMQRDESSALVAQLVSRLAATKGVKLLAYNENLVRIVDEKSDAFRSSLSALEILAEQTGNPALLGRVDEAKARIKALETAEAEAREAERRAQTRAKRAESAVVVAEQQFADEKERNAFLVAASSLDQDTVLNLHHQIMHQAGDVQHGVKRMMKKLRAGEAITNANWTDFLESTSFRISQIITATRFATKGGYKAQSTEIKEDLPVYISDYINTVSSYWAPQGLVVSVEGDNRGFVRKFKPIEIGIVIDNLVSNAAKSLASDLKFSLSVGKGAKPELSLIVDDNGKGWSKTIQPISRIFEKGVTSGTGSGLGLFHVKQVVEMLGGQIEAMEKLPDGKSSGVRFEIRIPS
jgi:signal transduction histidine kinase